MEQDLRSISAGLDGFKSHLGTTSFREITVELSIIEIKKEGKVYSFVYLEVAVLGRFQK
jgi:hypothetical protein